MHSELDKHTRVLEHTLSYQDSLLDEDASNAHSECSSDTAYVVSTVQVYSGCALAGALLIMTSTDVFRDAGWSCDRLEREE